MSDMQIEAVYRCGECDAYGRINYGISVVNGLIVCDMCEEPITSELCIDVVDNDY